MFRNRKTQAYWPALLMFAVFFGLGSGVLFGLWVQEDREGYFIAAVLAGSLAQLVAVAGVIGWGIASSGLPRLIAERPPVINNTVLTGRSDVAA